MTILQRILRLSLALAAMAMMFAFPARAEKKVALIIGNSAYRHTGMLTNPKNDATAIAATIRRMGFSNVMLKLDLDYQAMREAVRDFRQAAEDADVALIYFAGHGMEVAGENYLVPTDARLMRETDLEYEAVTLRSVLDVVNKTKRLSLVILDACRNNPLGDRMTRVAGSTRSVSRGLARIEPKGDVLVAYAARDGTVAADGVGRHSPYADALLSHLPTPGLDVRILMGRVRDTVVAKTARAQEPFVYGSLGGDNVALVPGNPITTHTVPTKPMPPQPKPSAGRNDRAVQSTHWLKVKDSQNKDDIRSYLELYPNGIYANLARSRLRSLDAPPVASPPPTSSRSALTSDAIIREVQDRLYNLNYNVGVRNGRLTPETVEAIRKWQANIKENATGEMTAPQLARLKQTNRPTNWGALAYYSKGASWTVWNHPTREGAESDALAACQKNAGAPCKVVTVAARICGALGFYNAWVDGRQHWGAYASVRPTLELATENALAECRAQARRPDACQIRTTVCADGSHKR